MNVNTQQQDQKGFTGATVNFTAALSTSTVHVAITVEGWYKLSADIDFYWTGPGASADITAGQACHEWARDTPQEVYCRNGDYLNIVAVGSVAGNYYVNRRA